MKRQIKTAMLFTLIIGGFFQIPFGQTNTQGIKVFHFYAMGADPHSWMPPVVTKALNEISAWPDQGFTVYHTDNEDDLANLKDYDIIYMNNNIKTGLCVSKPENKQYFEDFMSNGGKMVGIHAAGDHQTHAVDKAWPFYNGMFDGARYGGKVDGGAQNFTVQADPEMLADCALSRMWEDNDLGQIVNTFTEIYIWKFAFTNTVIRGQPGVTIMQTVYQSNWRDDHVSSWRKELPGGGEMLYTALGHREDEFTKLGDETWLKKASGAFIKYCAGLYSCIVTEGCKDPTASNYDEAATQACADNGCCTYDVSTAGKPGKPDQIQLSTDGLSIAYTGGYTVNMRNVNGESIISESSEGAWEYSFRDVPAGLYFVRVDSPEGSVQKRIMIK